jgi:hypothetical protein
MLYVHYNVVISEQLALHDILKLLMKKTDALRLKEVTFQKSLPLYTVTQVLFKQHFVIRSYL